MRLLWLVLIAFIAVTMPSLTHAQTVKLPAEIRSQPGRLASVRIEYDGDDVRWDVPPELDAFREYSPDPKDVRLRVQGFTPGKFRLIAVSAKAGKLSDFAACFVTIGDAPPTPPGPLPPGPNPPTPPTPPVPPDDPVAVRLREAIKKDADDIAEKKASTETLAGFFKAMAAHTKDPSVKTVGDLLSDYRAAVPSVLKPTAVQSLRRQIGSEIAELVGTDPSREISPELRDKLIKLFEFLALILKLLV